MKEELNKEFAQKIMTLKGEIKGGPFKTDMEFILKEKGEQGLKEVEKELEELGYPIKYKEIKNMDFFPAGLRVLSLMAIKKVLSFDDKKIEEMGSFATKVSFFVKLLIRYYITPEKVFFQKAPDLWQKQVTEGKLAPVELNREKKQAIARLEGINLHPMYCRYIQGYMSGMLKMLIVAKKITCQETKCTFKGDECHEYLIKWE